MALSIHATFFSIDKRNFICAMAMVRVDASIGSLNASEKTAGAAEIVGGETGADAGSGLE